MLKTKDLNDLKQRKNNKKSTKQLLILNHLMIYCIPQLCLFVLKLVVNHTVSQCSLTHLAIIYLKKEKANLPPLIYRCPILLKRVTPGKEPAWARMLSQPHTNTTLLSSGEEDPPTLSCALKCSISTLDSTCPWHRQDRFGLFKFLSERPKCF